MREKMVGKANMVVQETELEMGLMYCGSTAMPVMLKQSNNKEKARKNLRNCVASSCYMEVCSRK
jgi:hypothetical protein